MRKDILDIIDYAVKKADTYDSTLKMLKKLAPHSGRLFVFSIGKASVPMAKAAADFYGDKIFRGLVVTKYGHSKGFSSPFFKVIEAAHPLSDENSLRAAQVALRIAAKTEKDDTCLVLLSGGGSALFEKSAVLPDIQRDMTNKLLARGAPIDVINAVRRSISLVKGGKFSEALYPAKVITVALSDVLGNDKSVIASGLTVPDSTAPETLSAATGKYLPEYRKLISLLSKRRDAQTINDGGYFIIGDINTLCDAAEEKAAMLGYEVTSFSRSLCGEARKEAERLIAGIPKTKGKHAYIAGGETTVTLKGSGLGGRNQEMALAAAIALKGKKGIVFACAGSDGTDGPTDAAGGIADGESFFRIEKGGLDPLSALNNNDSYHALKLGGDLLVTGPTGTNVNDLTVILTDY